MSCVKELSLVKIDAYEEWKRKVLIDFGFIKKVELNAINEDISEEDYLKTLDPRNWKEQDHYAVLGLRSTRFHATEDDVRKNYRKLVLKHHPDKRANNGIVNIDDDYFACITKAYEILGDPVKRRSYDSVDPHFNDDIPTINAQSKMCFYETFDQIFKLNARWSVIQPVPELGNDESSREDVENFYSFWYSFDSWREFSYLDEEDKERGQDRGERRWIDKQNKIARQKRKKEEMTRIRQLTDNAYNCDPRVLRFKEEEKQRKIQQKLAREEAKKAKLKEEIENRKKAEEEERKLKEAEEEKQRALKEQSKKEKEALKKLKRKERKLLEQIFIDNEYFATNDSEKVTNLQDLDKICHSFSLEDMIKFKNLINSASKDQKKQLFLNEVQDFNNKINKEKEQNTVKSMKNNNIEDSNENSSKSWNHDDIQLLIKAVNLFPAGTQNRWDVIAEFITQHSTTGLHRKARDVLEKAKSLQKLDTSLKEEVNKKATTKFLDSVNKVNAVDEAAPSQRYETPAELHGFNPEPWSSEEQKLLEQALKTYPQSTVDRWDRIAECIPNRSKKDCIKRFKEIHEMVKAKNAARAAVASKTKKT